MMHKQAISRGRAYSGLRQKVMWNFCTQMRYWAKMPRA